MPTAHRQEPVWSFFLSLAILFTSALAVTHLLTASDTLRFSPQSSFAAYSAPLATTSDSSYNWSGYVAAEGRYTAVSGTWIVPEVSEGAGFSADAAWVGIGGVASRDLIQAGTQAIAIDGGVTYQAWMETLPAPSEPVPLRVRPGDSVSVSLTLARELQDGTQEWHVSFVNNTTGRTYATDVPYHSSLSSAEWIQEMPSLARGKSLIPLSDFGQVHFTGGSAVKDGVAQAIEDTGAEALMMTNYHGDKLAIPSVLSQGGFMVVRTDAAAGAASGEPRRSERVRILLRPL